MRNIKKTTLFLTLILSFFLTSSFPGYSQGIEKTFQAKKVVKISTITADCSIVKGQGGEIKVLMEHVGQEKFFKPIIEEDGDTLLLREKIPASDSSHWKLTVPDNTEIDFTSANGNFSVKGLKSDISATTASGEISAFGCQGNLVIKNASGEVRVEDHSGEADIKAVAGDILAKKITGTIRIKTLSGDIEAENLEGSIDLKVTSGDVEVEKAAGKLEASCVSGDIELSDTVITGESSFKVVSGDIYIKLAKTPVHDLILSSASGNAVLNYNGNPIKGHFEFRARADIGKIVSPINFDKEEETYEYGKKYFIKSFKKGTSPKIIIKTATGKAVLEE